MGIHFNNGQGRLYDKDSQEPLARIDYQLIETDATKYTRKKWWGEFSTGEEIKRLGNYTIEFDDSRRGECVVMANTPDRPREQKERQNTQRHYHFNGRGVLGHKK